MSHLTHGFQLHLLLAAPRVVVVLSQLLCHGLWGETGGTASDRCSVEVNTGYQRAEALLDHIWRYLPTSPLLPKNLDLEILGAELGNFRMASVRSTTERQPLSCLLRDSGNGM